MTGRTSRATAAAKAKAEAEDAPEAPEIPAEAPEAAADSPEAPEVPEETSVGAVGDGDVAADTEDPGAAADPAPADPDPAPDPVPADDAPDLSETAAGDQPDPETDADARAAALAAFLTSPGSDDGEEGEGLIDLDAPTLPTLTGVEVTLGDQGPFVIVFDAVNMAVGDAIHTAVKGDVVWITSDLQARLQDLGAIVELP